MYECRTQEVHIPLLTVHPLVALTVHPLVALTVHPLVALTVHPLVALTAHSLVALTAHLPVRAPTYQKLLRDDTVGGKRRRDPTRQSPIINTELSHVCESLPVSSIQRMR